MKTGRIIATCLSFTFLTACNLAPISQPTSTSTLPATIQPLPVAAEYLTDAKAVSYDPLDNMDNWLFHSETRLYALRTWRIVSPSVPEGRAASAHGNTKQD